MKNKEFFYLQYNKLNWQNQDKTKLNYFVNDFIIKEIISKKEGEEIKIFDMGFGIGFLLKMLEENLSKKYDKVILEGCEPSIKNYENFKKKEFNLKNVLVKTSNTSFLDTMTKDKFDFVTAVYVFPHFTFDELEKVAKKIKDMLNTSGKFILVVANQKYLEEKLEKKKDLFIEKNIQKFGNKEYKEILHYSEIPKIGTIIDYNREEILYQDLFKKYNFNLEEKKSLEDKGFICTIFVFSNQEK